MKIQILRLCIFLSLFGCSEAPEQNSAQDNQNQFRTIEENTIVNLYDAFGENIEGLTKDFGFSCIVNYKGKVILFDGGTNADIFKNNVKSMNINLLDVDIAIASHSHFDHINGFDYLLEINPDVKIYFPFDLFWGANRPIKIGGKDTTIVDSIPTRMQYFEGDYKGYKFNQTGRFWKANIEFVNESKEIEPGIKLITTTSTNMGYFNKYPSLEDCENCDENKARFNGLKEISLSLESVKGEILFVGCSHSTVDKIIVEAQQHTEKSIELVYGGFHLLPYDRNEIRRLAIRLKEDLNVKRIAPAHCTGHLAFKILQDKYKDNYVFAGLGETVSF